MSRYFLVGFFCLMFWCFIEPHLYSLCFYVRYRLFFKASIRDQELATEAGPFQMFVTGFTGALVFCFWPIYIVVLIARFVSLIFGRERLTHS